MAMPKVKNEIIQMFKQNDADTGSLEVQVALLTDRINKLNIHFKKNIHDFGSKRGLLKMVGRRRRFLSYIERHDVAKYKDIIARLELRK